MRVTQKLGVKLPCDGNELRIPELRLLEIVWIICLVGIQVPHTDDLVVQRRWELQRRLQCLQSCRFVAEGDEGCALALVRVQLVWLSSAVLYRSELGEEPPQPLLDVLGSLAHRHALQLQRIFAVDAGRFVAVFWHAVVPIHLLPCDSRHLRVVVKAIYLPHVGQPLEMPLHLAGAQPGLVESLGAWSPPDGVPRMLVRHRFWREQRIAPAHHVWDRQLPPTDTEVSLRLGSTF
mmetsp:Transcript_56726/g.91794  ORF Transcript_56726/g.91794 Transcript_56726/m.91794 type:complete len:234 (+) Transcript_56726:150-851(+)